ncbi:MAG: hypothetical protein K5657_00395 [Desulfovibrio sp.]|nr:hypothetical protein [Desulfovibrio sp.]
MQCGGFSDTIATQEGYTLKQKPHDLAAKWTQIAKSVKKTKTTQQKSIVSSVPRTNPSYYLFRNEAYFLGEDGFIYEMLPVDKPSLGYKLICSDLTKTTLLEKAVTITENQALNTLHKP